MRHTELKLGLIGFGTIGKGLARAIATGRARHTQLATVLIKPQNFETTTTCLGELGLNSLVTADPEEFFAVETDLIVEAAGQQVVREYAARVLQSGRDLLICASGAFTDEVLYEQLVGLAEQHGSRLLIPSGALAGIDALTSMAQAGVEEVTITTRKPPQAWIGTAAEKLVDLSSITTQPFCLFEGSAREAANLFPQNVNVAATLAWAGIGLDRTISRVFADPTVSRNVHQITLRGVCGEISIEVCGKPSPDNPRTSALTAYSVIKTIRNLTASVIIG